MRVIKAHAYGNDFVLAPAAQAGPDPSALARAVCHRHHGVGADGVIFYTLRYRGAAMTLFNADGSASELSGNGLRCLAAQVARVQRLPPGAEIRVETDAGTKVLELLGIEGTRYTFRAAMGQPQDVRQVEITVGGERMTATVMGMGNPQCVVLGPLPDERTFARLGPALATHALFPAGTNVEFAWVEAPDRVRILIWERGVGPTSSSGTGTSASAVAAAAHGGASREMAVEAPGGTQRVEWRPDGVYLTGWAEILVDGDWLLA
jgi:diaminopimelate epimerase